jgi:hypothetical protein
MQAIYNYIDKTTMFVEKNFSLPDLGLVLDMSKT